MPSRKVLSSIAAVSLLFQATLAKADSRATYIENLKKALKYTADGGDPVEEGRMIADAYKKYKDEQKKVVPQIGQDALGGLFPIAPLQPGSVQQLTFEFIDPGTGLPAMGPSVASVFYSYSPTPDDPASYIPIGTSTDAGTDFALPFKELSTEEVIAALPMDTSGAPIFIAGVDGYNVAEGFVANVAVPEPSSLPLLGIGVVSLLALLRFRSRRIIRS